MKNYWNQNGTLQAEYDALIKADFQFTAKEEKAFHRYYRYYNDGDLPQGAAYACTNDIENYLEQQANIAVAKAYKRYSKDHRKMVDYFASKNLVGFSK